MKDNCQVVVGKRIQGRFPHKNGLLQFVERSSKGFDSKWRIVYQNRICRKGHME